MQRNAIVESSQEKEVRKSEAFVDYAMQFLRFSIAARISSMKSVQLLRSSQILEDRTMFGDSTSSEVVICTSFASVFP